MQNTLAFGLMSLPLLAAHALAAVDTEAIAHGPPTITEAPATGASDAVAYKLLLGHLASAAEQDQRSYHYLLGDVFQVNILSDDLAGLQLVESLGAALLGQRAALEAEELGIRRHLLCAEGIQPRSPAEFKDTLERIAEEVDNTRVSHLQASLSEMPVQLRTHFEGFLDRFRGSISHRRLDLSRQLQTSESVESFVADTCVTASAEAYSHLRAGERQ
ncbi:MAG: hypothetical protein AAFN78_18665 [Pseudomonadota bacterium]